MYLVRLLKCKTQVLHLVWTDTFFVSGHLMHHLNSEHCVSVFPPLFQATLISFSAHDKQTHFTICTSVSRPCRYQIINEALALINEKDHDSKLNDSGLRNNKLEFNIWWRVEVKKKQQFI